MPSPQPHKSQRRCEAAACSYDTSSGSSLLLDQAIRTELRGSFSSEPPSSARHHQPIVGFLVCADALVKIGDRFQLHAVDLCNPVSDFFLDHILEKGAVPGFANLKSMKE